MGSTWALRLHGWRVKLGLGKFRVDWVAATLPVTDRSAVASGLARDARLCAAMMAQYDVDSLPPLVCHRSYL